MNLSIRPYAVGDAAALFEAATESIEAVFPWLPWCHPGYVLDEARVWVELQTEAFQKGEGFEFVITSPEGRFLGGCGLNRINRTDRVANLGYWVRSSAAGQGVAPAAVQSLAQWAFEHTDLNRLEIVAAVENKASQRVAEKAGATQECTARSRLWLHGHAVDAVVYSLVRGRARFE